MVSCHNVCYSLCRHVVAALLVSSSRRSGSPGPGLVTRFRQDFKIKFEDLFDDDTMTNYIYHCNAQTPR